MAARIAYTGNTVTTGLVLHLDAAKVDSYPKSGTTWFDLSGNGNHVTLYNGVSFSNGNLIFDGINDYARTDSTLNLSETTAVTVEVVFNVSTVNDGVMVFEQTANWNTTAGAFGAYTNSTGGSTTPPTTNNSIHTNANSGGNATNFLSTNLLTVSHYVFRYKTSTVTSMVQNGNIISPSGLNVSVVTGYANDFLYIGSRAGTSGFGQIILRVLKIYNRELSTAEISQNFNAIRGRYGI